MWFRSVIDGLKTRASRKPARRTPRSPEPSRFRPALEQLESREVPAQLNFAVNQVLSSVTLSGSLSIPAGGTVQLIQQGPGSLTTTVGGTIVADVDRTTGTIQFLNTTDLVLANSGSWEPKIGGAPGTDPANFGGAAALFSARAAVRGGEITFASGALALGGTSPRTFDTSQITAALTAGSLDYSSTVLSGTTALTGLSVSNSASAAGSLTQTGTSLTLTIPVSITYPVSISGGASANLTIAGSLQASAKVPFFVASVGAKAPIGVSQVQAIDADGAPRFPGFDPYSRALAGGVRVAVGDLTGDGVGEIVTGPGPGTAAKVRVFNGANGSAVGAGFFPYGTTFNQGISVAVGNVVDDLLSPGNEIVVSAAGRKVKVFDEAGVLLTQFSPFGAGYLGAVRLAVGDVNGSGLDEMVISRGAPVRVRTFGLTGLMASQVMPQFTPTGVKGNPFVAVGKVMGGTGASIVLGDASGGQVRVFKNDGTLQQTLPAPYGATFTGGVRVGVFDINNDGVLEIMTAPGATGGHRARAFRASDGAILAEFDVFSNYNGGFFVAGSS